MNAAGRRAGEENIFTADTDNQDQVKAALKFFISKKIDAMYAGTGDYTAFSLYDEAKKSGLKISEDFAIVGQDNAPISRAAEITTVSQTMTEKV